MKQNNNIHNGFLVGRLLLSSPNNNSDMFKRSCIIICAHDNDGAMGLILNKCEGNLKLMDLLIQMEMPTVDALYNPPIFTGGPMDTNHGFILHDTTYNESETVIVSNLFNLTATNDILEKIANGKSPQKYKIALGYTSWGSGQLEDELLNNNWISLPADHDIVFNSPNDMLWYSVLSKNGIEPSRIILHNGSA